MINLYDEVFYKNTKKIKLGREFERQYKQNFRVKILSNVVSSGIRIKKIFITKYPRETITKN